MAGETIQKAQREDLYHALTVEEFRSVLNDLRDDDLLVPNEVKNFALFRDGRFSGFIDLGKPAVFLYGGAEAE